MSATTLKRGMIGLAVIALLGLAAGCSDSSTNTDYGSLTDPSFQEVQPEVNMFLDSMFIAFSAGLSSYNEVPVTDNDINLFYGPVNPGQTVSSYEYTAEGWHHITFESNTGVHVIGINDSIQFSAAGVVQESADNADAMSYRHHWAVTSVDQTADYSNYRGDVNYDFTGLTSSTTTINGGYSYDVENHTESANVETDNQFAFTSTASNVRVNRPIGGWGAGCPSSGSVSFSISQTKIVTDTQASTVDTTATTWTGSMSFNDGRVTVSISDGTTTWAYASNICEPASELN